MKLAIGCDHAGFDLKQRLVELLKEQGHEVTDYGTHSADSTDYPDYAHLVAESVENGSAELGLLMCGSGNGINMTANKHQGIRAALCWTPEIAEMARLHNNANVLSLPARYIPEEVAINITEIFLGTNFEGGRHERRVNKISTEVKDC